jgi:uncharacterized protein (DUF302 family)
MGFKIDHGMKKVNSPRAFAETVTFFETLLKERGLTRFAKIDFSGDAAKAGLQMPPTQMLATIPRST